MSKTKELKIKQRRFLEFVEKNIGITAGTIYKKDGYYAYLVQRVLKNGRYTEDARPSLNDLRSDFIELYKLEQ